MLSHLTSSHHVFLFPHFSPGGFVFHLSGVSVFLTFLHASPRLSLFLLVFYLWELN